MKVSLPTNLSNLTNMQDLLRYLSPFCDQVKSAVNGKLSFADNLQVSTVHVYFPTANTNVVVHHGLPTTPTGYFSVGNSKAGFIYNGISLVLGATFANLKCDQNGLSAMILFF